MGGAQRNENTSRPTVFISYSWGSQRHKDWVRRVADELRSGWGVDAILDQTHLREGDDAIAFMERMVTDKDVDKVILICDCEYARKANSRQGGAGMEAQIISPEIYKQTAEDEGKKYVAVIREYDDRDEACVPAFYGGRIYIDMTDEVERAEKMEELVRWAYDAPLHEPVELGSVPQFVEDQDAPTLGTSGLVHRLSTALEQGRTEAVGVAENYFDTFAANIARFAIAPEAGRYELSDIVKGIEALKQPRDEAERVFLNLFRYRLGEEAAHRAVHRFIEKLMPYTDLKFEQTTDVELNRAQRQPYFFLVPEIFRLAVAALIRVEDFEGVGILTNEVYTAQRASGVRYGSVSREFAALQFGVEGLRDDRTAQSKLCRRTSGSGLSLAEIAQADLLLLVISLVREVLEEEQGKMAATWYPDVLRETIGWRADAFPLFARASSKRYLEKITSSIRLSVEQLKRGIAAADERFSKGRTQLASGRKQQPYEMMANADELGTLP